MEAADEGTFFVNLLGGRDAGAVGHQKRGGGGGGKAGEESG
jgi:hypothetical protein